MPRRKKESVEYARKRAHREVHSMLQPPESRHRWADLLKKARSIGMGPTTLKSHLDQLIRIGFAAKETEDTSSGPAVYYSLRDYSLWPAKFVELYRLVRELDLVKELISKEAEGAQSTEIYETTAKVHIHFSEVALPALLTAALGGRGPYRIDYRGKESNKELNELFARMKADSHTIADELLDLVIRPWIHKFLDAYEIFHFDLKHMLEEEAEIALRRALRTLKEYDTLIDPYKSATKP